MSYNTPNQPTKFRTKKWIEIDDESRVTHNTNSQIKFKTAGLKSSLYDYSDAYMIASETITVPNTGTTANPNKRKNIIIKSYAPFTNCISEIDNTQKDDCKGIGIVMPMYNLIDYSGNYSKTFGSLWQYCRDEPFLDANVAIADLMCFVLFKFTTKIAGRIGYNSIKSFKIRAL